MLTALRIGIYQKQFLSKVPAHAAVCNAIGAVAGVVSETCEILVNQPALNLFRVHDPAGNRDYADARSAIEEARRVSRELALSAARRAGATDPHVETSVTERRALAGADADVDYLAEEIVRSRATGRMSTTPIRNRSICTCWRPVRQPRP